MQSQLLHNNWFGKAVGACCAWIWAPSDPVVLAVAIISGISIGHLYDAWATHHADADQDTLANLARGNSRTPSPYLEFLFAAFGRLAKSTGQVSPKHIAYAQQLMHHMGLHGAAAVQAKSWFNQGKLDKFQFQQRSRDCLNPSSHGTASRLTMLRCMCTMACIETRDATLTCLKQLGGYLGFTPTRVAKEFGDIRNQVESHKQGSKYKTTNASSITQVPKPDHALALACKHLGIPKGANAAKAKDAYRRLISRHHPDKLPRNASENEKRLAAMKMVELRDALELIQAR